MLKKEISVFVAFKVYYNWKDCIVWIYLRLKPFGFAFVALAKDFILNYMRLINLLNLSRFKIILYESVFVTSKNACKKFTCFLECYQHWHFLTINIEFLVKRCAYFVGRGYFPFAMEFSSAWCWGTGTF